jgi:hypothetical protein
MKTIAACIILSLWTVLSYSQTVIIEDTNISFNSDQINISYTPTDLIAKITITTNKFKDGLHGLEFSFITKRKDKAPNINIDSIILTDSKNKILTLNKPYRDTIYYRNDGSLSLTVIHWLAKVQLETLRQENITKITIVVDSNPLTINVSKKSQRRIREIANANL